MLYKNATLKIFAPILVLIILALACGTSPTQIPDDATTTQATEPTVPQPSQTSQESELAATPTPTATPLPPMDNPPTPTPTDSPCVDLSGTIEVRILVGPSDAVGLEPHAVGNVPFSVTTNEPPYLVQGSGSINYADILTEQWGTYEVTMDIQFNVDGECNSAEGSAELQLALEMSGSQMVEVTSEGFHGEYPWSGTQNFDLLFPLEEGATIEGEGYTFVLHLNSQSHKSTEYN